MTHPPAPDPTHAHTHVADTAANEKNTLRVVILTSAMMVGEILGGWLFRSMALLADGFHMGTHAFALGVTLAAYWYARRNAKNPAFSFGAGKVSDLGGYTSAIFLLVVAFIMAVESFERFLDPVAIRYTEAITIACIGLAVNLASAWILRDHPDHDHPDHDHHAAHGQAHRDHNIKAAYLHVLADALTSILAIVALALGMLFGWVWMDPIMGIVGSVVITRWSIGLIRETSAILLDKTTNHELTERIRTRLQAGGQARVVDLHVWEIAPARYAVIASLETDHPQPVEQYKALLTEFDDVVHSTIEVQAASGSNSSG